MNISIQFLENIHLYVSYDIKHIRASLKRVSQGCDALVKNEVLQTNEIYMSAFTPFIVVSKNI